MNADMLSRIRILVFALAGLICATYSILALATNTANPISPWLLGFLASWLPGFLARLARLGWQLVLRCGYPPWPLGGVVLA